jgi:uncharacterized protein YciI
MTRASSPKRGLRVFLFESASGGVAARGGECALGVVFASIPIPPEGDEKMPLFTLALRFPASGDTRPRVRARHREYLDELKTNGKLVAAGPWGHDHGALIVYQAQDVDEARKLLDDDPYATEGVLASAELHEWEPVVGNASALS